MVFFIIVFSRQYSLMRYLCRQAVLFGTYFKIIIWKF